MVNTKIPFAIKNGKIVKISDVENGKNCNCVCTACGSNLIAKNNLKNKKLHHFAHSNSNECIHYEETMLHLIGKEILERNNKIKIPEVIADIGIGYAGKFKLYKERYIQYEKVYIENRFNSIVPDVIIETKNKQILIEIAVTHFVNTEKLAKIKKLGIAAIEIRLDNFTNEIDLTKIEDVIINSSDFKFWLNNEKVNDLQTEIESIKKKTIKIYRGDVVYCPLYGKIERHHECFYCDFYFGDNKGSSNVDEVIYCLGNKKENVIQTINKFASQEFKREYK